MTECGSKYFRVSSYCIYLLWLEIIVYFLQCCLLGDKMGNCSVNITVVNICYSDFQRSDEQRPNVVDYLLI